jgi:hypothetical protein
MLLAYYDNADFVTPREECCRDQTAEADKTSEKLADV